MVAGVPIRWQWVCAAGSSGSLVGSLVCVYWGRCLVWGISRAMVSGYSGWYGGGE